MDQNSVSMCSNLDNQSDFSDCKHETPKLIQSASEKREDSRKQDAVLSNLNGTTQLPIFNQTETSTLPETHQSECDNITDNDVEELNLAREQMITYVANSQAEDIFFRSQQRDEPALTAEEKKKIAASLLKSSPSNFLVRFGKILNPNHLTYFHQFENNYEVLFHLQQLEKQNKLTQTSVKNLRFHAMNEMIKEGKYFSMDEMRKRNPILFHELVEKYMSSDEKRLLEQEQPKLCNLSTIFMAHIDGDSENSKRRNEQRADQSAWDEALACEEEEEEDDDDDIDQEEKKFFRDEFISSIIYDIFIYFFFSINIYHFFKVCIVAFSVGVMKSSTTAKLILHIPKTMSYMKEMPKNDTLIVTNTILIRCMKSSKCHDL
jgi:hypothetical protein